MIGYIKWTLIHQSGITLTIETALGIGYEVLGAPSTIGHTLTGNPVELWIHHHRTDVSEVLFWFSSPEERELFQTLNRVNGVWGKTALNILGLGTENLKIAIMTEDDTLLSSVPGIGKKTAQKIIVDLKGSIDFSKKSNENKGKVHPSKTLLISSLTSMGYDKTIVENTVASIDENLSLEEKTRIAIRELSQL